ncbi:hypothetical protein HMPREF0514_10565 [Lactobacillus paragasseri JV-V03]|uniref:Uncharacterized protein n=1 Tax=Lactobacillus paragasseri JV-V03 TaxID=525326 RepID=A0AA87A4Y5_9LACO|nr:hypothetical protein HMPREF0514_10565 [Lactobacillus paragasseri JV-V03]
MVQLFNVLEKILGFKEEVLAKILEYGLFILMAHLLQTINLHLD